MRFFIGCHRPADAHRFPAAFVSISVLKNRRSDFTPNDWVLDSAAFSQLSRHARFLMSVEEYANHITRWSRCGTLLAAVAQDWMCEPWIVETTGLSVAEHQARSLESYYILKSLTPTLILPVLQGYAPQEYVRHLDSYQFSHGQWVGVGSVCKRNISPQQIRPVLLAIKAKRPDLRLHGFGVKLTSLRDPVIRQCLYSADSMAWSAAARWAKTDANDYRNGLKFSARIAEEPCQLAVPW